MIVLYSSHARSSHDDLFLDAFRDRGWKGVHVQIPARNGGDTPANGDDFVVKCNRPLGDTPDAAWVWLTDAAHQLRRIVADVRPDVVLAGPVPSVAAAFAMAGTDRLTALSWGSDVLVDSERSPWRQAVTRYSLENAVAAVGDCRAVRERILNYAPQLADRLLTIPWGVDVERFAPGERGRDVRRRLNWDDCTVLLSTRRLEPGYGIETLIEAFAKAAIRVSQLRLILCGDGSQSAPVAKQVQDLHLGERVCLAGAVSRSELPYYFQAADLYVSSAPSDGSSISLLEAMATGLPAVVSEGTGNVDWVTEDQNGWLAPPLDAEGLAKTLLKALDHRADWPRIAIVNRAAAVERANWRANREQLYQFLESVRETS